MAKKPLPTPDELRQWLRYEPETGKLFWKARHEDSVQSDNPRTRRRISRNWNARFENKEAFTTVSVRGYKIGTISCRHYYAHRVAWAIHYGDWPDNEIDHINGDRIDNRLDNLREATRRENGKNLTRQLRNQTGVIGVWWDDDRKRYQAYIRANGKRWHLGRFCTIEEASAARSAAEIVLGFHTNHGREPLGEDMNR